jgi:cellulose biosynthesis protein BcsQ
MDVIVPRTQAASEAFGASQPLVLRSPDDRASKAYAELAAHLATRLQ